MKKLLALVLALVMTMSLVTISNAAFKDADKIDYDEAVEVLNAIGVLVGDEKGNFNAKENLTREQAAKIISYLLLGNKTAEALVGAAKFTDVAATRWSAGFVDYCASTGVVAGNGDGTFAPAGQLTGFQFAKMLLVALGYDANIEGFTGTDWQINVSKVANQVGLFNGLSISGTAVLTREQAAQMCLNTLKAPLVQYSNKGGNISVNGAVIEIGASKAEYVTTTLAKEQRISDRTLTNTTTTLNGGYTVEFGEKYYPALELKSNETDDFGRPSHKWLINNKKIGSYVDYDQMVAEYTASVTGKELYNLLGSSIIKEYDTTYYVDGKTSTVIKASNMIKTNTADYSTTDNGVLTQVFVDDEDKDITIVSINTYFATADTDYNTKKETLSVTVKNADQNLNTAAIKLDDVAGIEGYKKDDVLFVNYAWNDSTNKYDIVAVMDPAQTMTDTKISKFKVDSYAVVGGTQYDYAEKVYIDAANSNFNTYAGGTELTKFTYNLYLDQYGYVLGITEFSGTSNYVFLIGYDKPVSNLTKKTAEAAAIFVEDGAGVMKTITVNFSDSNDNLDDKLLAGGEPDKNTWFTYSVDKNGVYTLNDDVNALNVSTTYIDSLDADKLKINPASVRLINNANPSTTRAYGNDNSVYVTVEAKADVVDGVRINNVLHDDAITKVTASYTGVQDIDLIVNKDAIGEITDKVFAIYDRENYIIAAVVIGVDNSKTDSYAYALKAAKNEYVDADDYYYWDFEAVVDGEIKTLTVKSKYATLRDEIEHQCAAGKNGLFQLTYDKDGYVTDAVLMSDSGDTAGKVYGNTDYSKDIDPDNQKVYAVEYRDGGLADFVVTGKTLYGHATDAGLTLAKDAPVIVAQPKQKVNASGQAIGDPSFVYESYNNLETALKALAGEGENFKGWVCAVLDKKGTAQYIVLNDTAAVTYTVDDGTTPVAPTKVTAVSAAYDKATKKLTVTLDGAAAADKNTVVLSQLVNGVNFKVGEYTVTGTAAEITVTLSDGRYGVTCGNMGATFTVDP